MGRRGPAPKPTALKKLAGNPGKRALPKHEPKPKAGTVAPKAPAHLDKLGKAEWNRVAPELHRLGLLTDVDHAALEAYCTVYARWCDAERLLAKEGLTFETPNGYVQQRPELSIAHKALEMIKVFCAEFGLTPSSRARMQVPEPPKPEDPLEEFLNRGKKEA